MTNIFEKALNLPFTFHPIFDMSVNKPHTKFKLTEKNKEFIDYLESKDIDTNYGERFYLNPIRTDQLPIHIDVFLPQQSDSIVKINFVYCDKDSYMNWYELTENTKLEIIPTSVDSYYKVLDRSEAKLVHTVKTDRPRLINAGIPHDIYPPVSSPRYTFSFILIRKSTGVKISWNEALEIFKENIVEE